MSPTNREAVELTDQGNFAIAAFTNGNATQIVVGNVPNGRRGEVLSFLGQEAADFFGKTTKEGFREGSVAGVGECYVEVTAAPQRVLAFIRERLGGGPSQMRLQ